MFLPITKMVTQAYVSMILRRFEFFLFMGSSKLLHFPVSYLGFGLSVKIPLCLR